MEDHPSGPRPHRSLRPKIHLLTEKILKKIPFLRRYSDTTLEEIKKLVDEDGEEIDFGSKALLINIAKLQNKEVSDIMMPRADIIAVDSQCSLDDLVDIFQKENFSRLPVYENTLDEVIGCVHVKDLLQWWKSDQSFLVKKILRPIEFVAPSIHVLDLLLHMRQTRCHLALVIDEYGGVDGLVTIEDLVEEIVGDIQDEHDESPELMVERRNDGSLVIDARMPLEEFESSFSSFVTPEERDNIDTLGGLIFALVGRIPIRGEIVKHSSGIEFEIMDVDLRMIKKIRIRSLPQVFSTTAKPTEPLE